MKQQEKQNLQGYIYQGQPTFAVMKAVLVLLKKMPALEKLPAETDPAYYSQNQQQNQTIQNTAYQLANPYGGGGGGGSSGATYNIDLTEIDLKKISDEDHKSLEKFIGIEQKKIQFMKKETVSSLPVGAQHLYEFCFTVLRILRFRKSAKYKEQVNQIEKNQKECNKAKDQVSEQLQ